MDQFKSEGDNYECIHCGNLLTEDECQWHICKGTKADKSIEQTIKDVLDGKFGPHKKTE